MLRIFIQEEYTEICKKRGANICTPAYYLLGVFLFHFPSITTIEQVINAFVFAIGLTLIHLIFV